MPASPRLNASPSAPWRRRARGRRGGLLLALGLLSLNAACSSLNPYYDASLPHHRVDGFQNNHINFQPKGLQAMLAWKWEALREGLPREAQQPTPRVSPDLAFLRANARAGGAMQASATWIGHATVLLQLGGLTVLTDPIFSERASPVSFVGPRRAVAPGLALEELPHVDLVVVSHNHYDHLDEASVLALSRQPGGSPRFLVPLGNKAWFEALGIRAVREMDWWQTERLGAVEVTMTPVQHWSGRGLGDRMQSLWGGWVIRAPGFTAFHAGDTGYSADFAEIGRRFAPQGGIDLALLPVGAYAPRWFMQTQHINPAEAVRIHRELRARRSLGMHWGTFALTDESLDDPPQALAAARKDAGVSADDFFLLAVGETRKLPPRAPAAPGATAAAAPATHTP